ncbi:hypothetical protein DICPUDRAFT_29910 [Dictyostelium purpureum]|uniref:CS domain-containing protein n=1 Tax=Dictyostelium purpureum TaxID=5786 RepID=F0ZEF5_DICPU|nr:uncharacterized protein DICPUDRAFT_29910 [Dictyostelium purpureum]EGC37685.1 hypothetical protein DICPUDRAFT_29910 [Dictyostelium purpureum]|eukprot:XP_003285789.1 hypothetical protein DICPUDRAFT_29910 [Dictyostelium purpureum]
MTQINKCERYTWTQTLNDCTISIKLDNPVKSKDLLIKIDNDHLTVKNNTNNDTIINGKLHKNVKKNDCNWTLESGKNIEIELCKLKGQEWWASIIEGENEIDVTQIKPQNSTLSDLDGETKAMVEKMMYNQTRKAQNLPTTDELEREKILEDFKSQHPNMDFSNAKFN